MTSELILPHSDLPFPLGRAGAHHDPRNRQFGAFDSSLPPRRARAGMAHLTRRLFDQGAESSCTAQAAIGVMMTTPYLGNFKTLYHQYDTPEERFDLYVESKRHDPWFGEDYEGTSTDAPWKVLRNRGHIAGWRWLFGIDEVREYVTWYGPIAVGTLWYEEMFYPESHGGYLVPEGWQAGGHAYRIVQYNLRKKAFRVVNSWGRDWGTLGRAWISDEVLDQLLRDDGEAVTAAV